MVKKADISKDGVVVGVEREEVKPLKHRAMSAKLMNFQANSQKEFDRLKVQKKYLADLKHQNSVDFTTAKTELVSYQKDLAIMHKTIERKSKYNWSSIDVMIEKNSDLFDAYFKCEKKIDQLDRKVKQLEKQKIRLQLVRACDLELPPEYEKDLVE